MSHFTQSGSTCQNKNKSVKKLFVLERNKAPFFSMKAIMSILLYGCSTGMLTKRKERKLDGNYIRMLRAVLNKSYGQHSTKQQLYGHLLPIFKTIQTRRVRHVGHCWRSKGELISDVLTRTSKGRATSEKLSTIALYWYKMLHGRPAENKDERRERVREIRASGMLWWWGFYTIELYIICIRIVIRAMVWFDIFI